MSATITTERLTLRTPRLEDAGKLGPMLRAWEVVRHTGSIPKGQPDVGLEGYFLIVLARAGLGREHVFVIEPKGEAPAGVISLSLRREGVYEIGYWLGEPYWRRGLASEAAGALTRYAFETLKAKEVIAGHYVDNPVSGRVLEKAGFRATGEVLEKFSLARCARAPSRQWACATA